MMAAAIVVGSTVITLAVTLFFIHRSI